MKRFFVLLSALLFICSCSKGVICEDIGNMGASQYPEDAYSRTPWDMIFHEGALYIGGGDFGANTGPVPLWRYDEAAGEWSLDTTLPDEQIARFTLLSDGSLAVPGTDPKDDWSYGNLYLRDDTGWRTVRTVPGGVHVFDLAEYDSALFAACGVTDGYPMRVSCDGGDSWREIEFISDGERVLTDGYVNIRSYELFAFGGELYATLCLSDETKPTSYGIYRYDGEAFVYHAPFTSRLSGVRFSHFPVADHTECEWGAYLATGHLYFSRDMKEYTRISLGDADTLVYDVCEYDGRVYALTAKETKEKGYLISVFSCKEKEPASFKKLFSFTYDAPAISFAFSERFVYFGIGGDGEKSGTVLKIEK